MKRHRPGADAEYRRGFLAVVRCRIGEWLREGEALVERWPIEEVLFRPDPSADPAALAAAPSLRRVRSLILSHVGLGDAGAVLLAHSPFLAGLRELSLGGNDLTAVAVDHLAAAPTLAGLIELDLRDNPLGDSGSRSLTGSPTFANLLSLQLVNTQLGNQAVARLVSEAAPWSGLRSLYLGHNYVSGRGARYLVEGRCAAFESLICERIVSTTQECASWRRRKSWMASNCSTWSAIPSDRWRPPLCANASVRASTSERSALSRSLDDRLPPRRIPELTPLKQEHLTAAQGQARADQGDACP